jgi:hypothetical protein
MKATEATALFRGKDKLNCAQAVLKAFQSVFNISDVDIRLSASAGSGKAEGGVCGALHAARVILKDSPFLLKIEREFEARAGSLLCREIRKLNKLPCRGCVALSAELLEQYSTNS